jgi:hypothetical protein
MGILVLMTRFEPKARMGGEFFHDWFSDWFNVWYIFLCYLDRCVLRRWIDMEERYISVIIIITVAAVSRITRYILYAGSFLSLHSVTAFCTRG